MLCLQCAIDFYNSRPIKNKFCSINTFCLPHTHTHWTFLAIHLWLATETDSFKN